MKLAHLCAAAALCGLVAVIPRPAAACGGFFCNAATQSPIYQAGERIVFAQEGDRVAMHIEIAYQGDPTQFGWVLPLVEAPTDAEGEPLPLEEAVSLSSGRLFDVLQAQTDPVFTVSNTFEGTECSVNVASAGGQQSYDSASYPESPTVAVLQEVPIGPYAAQLVKATDADALYTWLEENGYTQDEAARPVLAYYVKAGYVFLGLRLQSGKSTGDMRPIAIYQGEQAPCVPLRLTGIAATPNMAMLVWVLGQARAVPKNFIHAVVNPAAITFPGGGNYLQVVNDAVDTLVGHAWVTEFAGSAAQFRGDFYSGDTLRETRLAEATTLTEILNRVNDLGILANDETQDILRVEVPMPDGLHGYPNNDCYSTNDWRRGGCDDEGHVTTEDEFYSALPYWASKEGVTIEVDAPKLTGRLMAEVVAPLKDIEALFAKAKTVTRFYTTQDPEEMTKDPIFAFNADLPDVSNQHQLTTVIHRQGCGGATLIATWETGQVQVLPCESDSCFEYSQVPAVPGAPALFEAEVLDESGPPMAFDPAFAAQVDGALTLAEPGKPSLPASFVLPPAPAKDFPTSVPAVSSSGCSAASAGLPAAMGALALVLVVLGARAAGRERGEG